MSEHTEEELDGEPFPASVREAVLYSATGETTHEYPVGTLTVEREGSEVLIDIIIISEVQVVCLLPSQLQRGTGK